MSSNETYQGPQEFTYNQIKIGKIVIVSGPGAAYWLRGSFPLTHPEPGSKVGIFTCTLIIPLWCSEWIPQFRWSMAQPWNQWQAQQRYMLFGVCTIKRLVWKKGGKGEGSKKVGRQGKSKRRLEYDGNTPNQFLEEILEQRSAMSRTGWWWT